MERENYDLISETWSELHVSSRNIVKQLLCPRENERITAKEAKNCEWLKEVLGF